MLIRFLRAGVVQSIKTVTRIRSEMVAKFAFDYAVEHGHCRITALHKANVMRLSDGTFLRACRNVASSYADRVEYEEELLDKFCLRVGEDPSRYDVLLTPSLYGAFATAVCGTLSGGAITVPTAAYGSDRLAVFGTMLDGSGSGSEYHDSVDRPDQCMAVVANPTGLIRAAAWMLAHAGMIDLGLRVDAALVKTLLYGIRTRDMGGSASCGQFVDAVIRNLCER